MSGSALEQAAPQIQLLMLDCDGVLTDGGVILGTDEQEFKRFDIQDGMGVSLAKRAGLRVGVITGRSSHAVTRRARELHLDELIQGAKDKVEALDQVCERQGLTRSQVAYMGDDIQDLAILMACGLSLAPANARPEVLQRVDHVTTNRGGHGAVREVIETLLKAQGHWDKLVEDFLQGATPP